MSMKSLRNPLVLLLSRDLQLVCKLWAGEPLHHSYAKLLLPLPAPEEDPQCSVTRAAHTPVTHTQTRAGTLEICSSNSLLDKSICRYRVTHHMSTHGTHCGHQEPPRALGTSPSTPLRCPGRAAWDRESHCHLVGKGCIASTLPPGTAGSEPPPCKIPGPAGEQDPRNPNVPGLEEEEGKGREPHTYQS